MSRDAECRSRTAAIVIRINIWQQIAVVDPAAGPLRGDLKNVAREPS
jgi:hypothetical protein